MHLRLEMSWQFIKGLNLPGHEFMSGLPFKFHSRPSSKVCCRHQVRLSVQLLAVLLWPHYTVMATRFSPHRTPTMQRDPPYAAALLAWNASLLSVRCRSALWFAIVQIEPVVVGESSANSRLEIRKGRRHVVHTRTFTTKNHHFCPPCTGSSAWKLRTQSAMLSTCTAVSF